MVYRQGNGVKAVTKAGDDLLWSLNETLAHVRGQGPATVRVFEDAGANGWQKIQPEKQAVLNHQGRSLLNFLVACKVHWVLGVSNEDADFGGTTGQNSAVTEIFMCGLAGFMKAARATVGEISVTVLNEECFGKKIVIEDKNAVGGEIYFALSGKHGAYAPGEILLKAALNAGIWIDRSCSRVSAATAR